MTKDSFPSTPSTLGPPTFLDVMHAYSLVTSRAFQVDAFHGAAMVPLADISNHRENNHVCFEVSVSTALQAPRSEAYGAVLMEESSLSFVPV